jgi:hypothetical protein
MACMDNENHLAFHGTLENICVVTAVATIVAGPILGLWGLRFHKLMLEAGSRPMAVGALFSCWMVAESC